MTRRVGIDLGTTWSAVAEVQRGRPAVLVLSGGERALPSVVRAKADGTTVVGTAALRAQALDPDGTIGFFKPEMGTREAAFLLNGREWTPARLSAAVLAELLRAAGLRTDEVRATITVPAYFDDHARVATMDAARLCGLEVDDLIHEPSAAALACGIGGRREETVVVYDLGGGTFDVSVVRLDPRQATVLATGGDHELGGREFDQVLVALVAERFRERHGVDPQDDATALALLTAQAESAKRALSERRDAEVPVVVGALADTVSVSRDDFEDHARPLLLTTADVLERVVADSGVATHALDAVLLVGGSSRMPMCERLVRERLPVDVRAGFNPSEVVVLGAALHAAGHETSSALTTRRLQDVTAHALGYVMINADATAFVNDVMLARNAPLPAQATKRRAVKTTSRGPNELHVHLLQGEQHRPVDNIALGRCTFSGIAHTTGEAHIDVSFAYDGDAMVQVTAIVDGVPLEPPRLERDDRDLSWTLEPPPVAQAQLDVVLVIDVSRSMMGRRLRAAKQACRAFLDELGDGPRTGLVSFHTQARIEVPVTGDRAEVRRAVERLDIRGGTDVAVGLDAAAGLLHGGATTGIGTLGVRAEDSARRAILLLTDGQTRREGHAIRLAGRLAESGIEIVPVGLPGADRGFLEAIATGDRTDLMTSTATLADAFRGIARELAVQEGGLRR